MYCSYHPSNAAKIGCTNCSRPLCSYCDHRIKGYPYCQDCIVMGIEALSRHRNANKRAKNRGRLAALLALVPGLGAVYNHQNVKAIFHFIGVILLFQLTEIKSLDVLFALAGTVAYFYTIIDAYRTGERIGNGEDPHVDEARFKRELASRATGLGLLLLVG
ncbi:MAG TPA: hypothetical protein VJX67_20935, partial [Blastocatellia bacterium]|nr:hypothetical protein [Blastocatellia bacterium]